MPNLTRPLRLRALRRPKALAAAVIAALAATTLTGGGAPATAQTVDTAPLRALATQDEAATWSAVGRLDFGEGSFCTGTLIEPRLVLTAAHCLYDATGMERLNDAAISFLAGFRDGRAAAYRGVRRSVVHPDYPPLGQGLARNATDLALIELDRPIGPAEIAPMPVVDQSPAVTGEPVGVVSYAHDRAERPSLQELCHVLGRREGAFILTCDVDFGASGSPIFSIRGGVPAIVSVVSAKAKMREQKVSIGTSLRQPLADLKDLLMRGDGVFTRAKPEVERLTTEVARSRSGAKFLRPGG